MCIRVDSWLNTAMSEGGKSDRTPVMMSAFVYPGAGQFLQKRWVAGTVYSVLFTALSLVLIIEVVKPMFHNITAAMDWAAAQNSDQSFEGISLSGVLFSFLAMLVVYVVNVMDVVRASRQTFKPPPLPPTA